MSYPVQETELRPRRWVLPLIFLPALGVFVYIFATDPRQQLLIPLFIAVAVFAFVFFAFSKTKIYFNDQGIGYRTIFTNRFMNWQDIRKSFLKYQHRGKSGHFAWIMEDAAGTRVKIPMGLHSRANYRVIAETLRVKAPQASLEPRILQMSEGIFRWYIF